MLSFGLSEIPESTSALVDIQQRDAERNEVVETSLDAQHLLPTHVNVCFVIFLHSNSYRSVLFCFVLCWFLHGHTRV